MKSIERITYLLIILGLITFNANMSIKFTNHYDLLLNDLKEIEKICEGTAQTKYKKQCPL